MRKILAFQKEKFRYSDKTVCILGPKYDGNCLLGSDQIRWEKGEFSRPISTQGVNTTSFKYPSLELGGWAFGSIPAFNPEQMKRLEGSVEYPFGGTNLYARLGSPQHQKLSAIISYLERVPGGVLAPSGVAASHMAVLFNMPKNGLVLRSTPIYDCTRSAFDEIYPKFGIKVEATDFTDLKKLEAAIIKNKPNKLYLESPANPTMAMIDLKGVYTLAVKYNISEIIVDNTFASPIIQKPVEIVGGDPYKKIRIIHSGTKHFTGGLDGICWGYTSLIDWKEYVSMLLFQKDMGYNMSSLDAEAVLHHGIPTLDVRVKDQSANALKVAQFLEKHPLIKKVNYPGLAPFKEMADKVFTGNGYGSVLHFELDPQALVGDGDNQEALKASEAFGDILALQSFISLAVSLGKMSTLIENSWFMVHRFMKDEDKIKSGISPFGWRLAVGSEDADDIIRELTMILDLVKNKEFRNKVAEMKDNIGRPKQLLAMAG